MHDCVRVQNFDIIFSMIYEFELNRYQKNKNVKALEFSLQVFFYTFLTSKYYNQVALNKVHNRNIQ